MNAELSLKEILSKVKKLNKPEKVTLLKKLTLMLTREEKTSKSAKFSEISGLGSTLWHNIDIDQYADN